MDKYTLVVSPSSLDSYQTCPTKYAYHKIMEIEPAEIKKSLEVGSRLGDMINEINIKIKEVDRIDINAMEKALWAVFIPKNYGKHLRGFSLEQQNLFLELMDQYADMVLKDKWKIIGVETAFSKTIYEDENNLFVVEGKLDIVVNDNGAILVGDNKTQSSKYEIYPFNNQVLAYLWAAGTTRFFYNYLTYTKKPEVRRDHINFAPQHVKEWERETIACMFKIKESRLSHDFAMYRSGCTSKMYGICDYVRLCEQPNSNVKEHLIKSMFKPREKHELFPVITDTEVISNA